MTNIQLQLKAMIDIFEAKVNRAEEDYRKKHETDFNEDKMERYVNNKLKREIKMLAICNMMPSLEVLRNSERFKY